MRNSSLTRGRSQRYKSRYPSLVTYVHLYYVEGAMKGECLTCLRDGYLKLVRLIESMIV